MIILILYPTCPHLGQESVSVGVAGAGGGGHLGLLTGVSLLGGLSVLHGSFCLVTLLVFCSVSTLGMVAEVGWLHCVLTVLYHNMLRPISTHWVLCGPLGLLAEVGCHPGHRSTDTAYRSREPWERTGGYKVTPE